MKKININEAIGAGWNKFMERPWYLLGVTTSFWVLFLISASSQAWATALSFIIYAGFMAVLFMHFRGIKIEFDDIFSIDNRWISLAFTSLIKSALLLLGFIALIVPGVYFAVRWMFAELIVVDRGLRPMAALRASSEMTRGHWWALFGYSVVLTLLMILGFILFIVGAVVASIVLTFATIALYEDLKPSPSEN
jgi:uncharacterized membrane protein